MPKGYILVSYRDAPNDENLSKYATKALEAMTNAGAKFIARGMPVATFENGIQQRTVIVELKAPMQLEPLSQVMLIRLHLHY